MHPFQSISHINKLCKQTNINWCLDIIKPIVIHNNIFNIRYSIGSPCFNYYLTNTFVLSKSCVIKKPLFVPWMKNKHISLSHATDDMLLGAVLPTVGRSYVGNDVTHSMLLDRACACFYDDRPKYRLSFRVSTTAPWSVNLPVCLAELPAVRCQNTPAPALRPSAAHLPHSPSPLSTGCHSNLTATWLALQYREHSHW